MGLRAVAADRLALALADAQPADELGTDHEAEEESGQRRRAGAEGDIADQVEHMGKAKMLGEQIQHKSYPPAKARTTPASPTEFDPLTRTASPGAIRRKA